MWLRLPWWVTQSGVFGALGVVVIRDLKRVIAKKLVR